MMMTMMMNRLVIEPHKGLFFITPNDTNFKTDLNSSSHYVILHKKSKAGILGNLLKYYKVEVSK
jgi:hypothetical protein